MAKILTDREKFFAKMESKAVRRLPARTREKLSKGTLFSKRNKRIAIREAALRRVQCIIKYRKITTNEVKKYIIAPLEMKYRRLRVGFRKVLYASDMEDKKRTKSFVLNNIFSVALTDRKYRPLYPIKIY